jgi:hypothetical protein
MLDEAMYGRGPASLAGGRWLPAGFLDGADQFGEWSLEAVFTQPSPWPKPADGKAPDPNSPFVNDQRTD